MIVVIAGEKGGTGKTTIATNLAIIRAQKGADVLLADADSQRSAVEFFAVREQEGHHPSVCCAGISGPGTYDEIRKLSQKFDDTVIDVGGRDTITLRKALLAADVAIIPFIPSQLDVWGLDRTDEIIRDAKTLNENLRAVSVMNKADSNTKIVLGEEAVNLIKDLKSIKFSGITIVYRVSYRRCIADGIAVTELTKSKKDEKAAAEMIGLYNEVFGDA